MAFLYDHFFSPDKANGIHVTITVAGQELPFTLKRGVSFRDVADAKAQATKTRVKPTGEIEPYEFSEKIMNIEILAKTLREWPFQYSDGSEVPLTRENIADLDGDVVQALVEQIAKVVQEKRKALDPTGSK
jgi:hypothetical protein